MNRLSVLARVALIGLVASMALACGANQRGNGASSQGTSAANTTSSAPPGPPVKLTMSYVGVANEAPIWIAKENGIFQKHGLDVDLQQIPGPAGVAALTAGQTQVFAGGGSEVLNAAANGADLSVLAVVIPIFPFKLYAQNRLKTPADLKGKKLGITSAGGSYDTALRQALPKLGVDPKDVAFVATGSIANVTTGMISGSIDGAAVQIGPDSQKIDDSKCCGVLFDFASISLPNAQNVIAMQRSYISAHHDVAQRLIDSYMEANALEQRDKNAGFDAMKKYLKIDEPTLLQTTYDYYARDSVQPLVPLPRVEQYATYVQQLGAQNEKVKSYDVSKLIDPSFVQNAADRGIGKK